MKNFKKIITLYCCMIFLLAFTISVSAVTEYTEIGTVNHLFELGTGFFNEQLTNYSTFTRAISSPAFIPLIADLDNDGIKEIVVLDGSNIRLYNNKELDIVDAYLNDNIVGTPYMMLFDIDDDNFTEIITASSSNNSIDIISWNGTGFVIENTLDVGSSHNTGEIMLSCKGVEDCFVTYIKDIGNVASQVVYGRYFNSTSIGSESIVYAGNSVNSETICFPRISSISIADYDNDAEDEYIYSFYEVETGSGNDEFRIVYITINSSNDVVNEMNIEVTNMVEIYTSGTGINFDCTSSNENYRIGNYISSPLVFDIDGSPSNGLETVIGFMTQISPVDEYKMNSFDKNGNFLDDYPEVTQSDGIIISNPFRANAFPDTGDVDFCIVGYIQDFIAGVPEIDVVDITCASEQSSFIPETSEFFADIEGLYNITRGFGSWNVLSHSAQHSTLTTDGNNLDEIVNSYGVFLLNWTTLSCDLTGSCDARLIFETPIENTVLLALDYEDVGRDDFILLSGTNLWYVDDEFTNSGGEIDSYYINPCLDATWKVNTSVEIRITVTDYDNDNVNSNATLYYNSPFIQSAVSINASSGTTFTYWFTANETIGTGAIRLVGKDIENPDESDIIDLSISVGTEGVEWGDCTTDVDVITTTEAEEEIAPEEPEVEDALSNTLDDIDSITGLGLGRNIMWLIIMIVLAFVIWNANSENPQATFGVIAIVEVLMLVVGVKLGYIGIGIIFIVVIAFLGTIAVKFRQMVTGGG